MFAAQLTSISPVRFAESLEVDDFSLPQEPDYIVYIRVVRQAKDVVIGDASLLLCCIVLTTNLFQKFQ